MNLYLLSCENIQSFADSILPLLPEQRRLSFARSRSALSLGAGLLLSSLLGAKKDEDLIFGPQGKPALASGAPEFSLSHSGDHVLLGVSVSPIGVDMERRSRIVAPNVQQRICLPQEKELDPLLVFTRKECTMKLTGLGFRLPLQDIDTTAPFRWQDQEYRFFTTEQAGYVLSVLTSEDRLPPIQALTVEELL